MGGNLPAITGPVSDGFTDQELVRPDGTVLVQFVAPPNTVIRWEPPLGFDIVGLCYGRIRHLPDGEWMVIACFPEGFPGPMQWSVPLPDGVPPGTLIEISYEFVE